MLSTDKNVLNNFIFKMSHSLKENYKHMVTVSFGLLHSKAYYEATQ